VDSVLIQAEIEELRKRVTELEAKAKYRQKRMVYADIKHNAELLSHYTGLPSSVEFDAVLNLCSRFEINYVKKWRVVELALEEQLLMTLMKLRRNLSHLDLAYRFNVSDSCVSNVITTWIHVLHELLFEAMMVGNGIPSGLKNQSSTPACFSSFSSCRIILDCTEIQCAIPSSMDKQCATYSNYKKRNTLKALVGVAPNGVITYVSELHPGSRSDKEIVRHSKVLNQMKPGDLVLADKGFLIQDLMPAGVTLNLPPFLNQAQFTVAQAELTVRIARARIHVERGIQRIKCFKILDFIPSHYCNLSTEIFQLCAALVNLQFPLIREIA
jgi:hypothetical protein